uniref:MSP domain-containing protein n=2 Tax=Triparma pacifica TaxID=91992 RepID=A0A7S2QVW6_9STRA
MTYKLSVPQDGAFVKREFSLEPSSGSLEPGCQQEVKMDLISTTVKTYEYSLVVDIEGVGENLLSLPILADCKVPKITVKNKEVEYGDTFIRFPYTRDLVLVNEDPELSAKYEIISQDPSTFQIATYEAIPPIGSVPPNSETKVKIKTIGEKLGNFRLPLMLQISGSVEPPLQSSIVANVIGPKISLFHKDLPCKSIKWGSTTCLIDDPRPLVMRNDSEIPAPFKIFLKSARSKFRVDVRDGVLSPHESVAVNVIANLDDTIVHKDQLHIIVSEGENLMVQLTARGMGTTLYSHDDLKVIDFGATFTNQQCSKYITIENKGRRPQSLKWINQTIKDRMLSQAAKNRKQDDSKPKKKPSLDPVFIINPPEIELPPRTHIRFQLIGFSKHKGLCMERLLLETKVLKDKQARIVFDTEIKADFMNPLLDLSVPALDYSYTWEKDVPIEIITKPMTMTNRTPLPLHFVLKAQIPYTIDQWEHSLAPQESATINVDFDPGYKADRQSHIAESALTAVYKGHPQRDNIKLTGEINFPNLDFEYTVINFGCVLNDTTKTMLVKVTNVSKVDTAFSWSFVEDEDAARSTATTKKPYIPVNQVFDILPIRSYLRPGESEDIEFVYYGHSNRRFKGLTVCEVEGGPEYEITLLGEASQVGFKLDRSLVDFGKVLHTKSEECEFSIINTGKVAFNYTISDKLVSRANLFEISHPTGKVFPNEKQKIVVRFKPGLPEKVFEKLILEIAHFDPVEFPIYGEGIYCQLGVTLPRDENVNPWGLPLSSGLPSWPEMLEEARCNLVDPDPKLFVPKDDTLPPPPNATSNLPTNLVPPVTASTMGGTSSRPMTGATMLSSPGSSNYTDSRPGTRGTIPESRPGSSAPNNPFPVLDAFPAFETGVHNVREPTPQEIEMEANRLIFMKHLTGQAVPVNRSAASGNPNAITSAPATISEEKKDDTVSLEKPSTAASTASSKKKKDPFIIARHVSNFGHVILGQTRKRTFKITNTSALGQLSWVFDKNILAGTGFSLEPEKVVRLPENQSVSFNVTFSAKKNFALGEREVIVPLDVKNGPSMIIILRAIVTVPELTVSQDHVDFGPVWVGCVKRVFLQLKNVSPVNADWDFKKAMGNTKDELNFKIEPRGGLLAPGQCTNVSIEFVPVDERPHALKIPLKVASGNKAKNILLTGMGEQVHLTLSPSLAEFGPILPKTPGGITKVITLTNESSKSVEVYSVDFDKKYITEEEILMKVSGYGEDGVMQLPVRSPGEPLPPHIMAEYDKIVAKEEKKKAKEERIKAREAAVAAAIEAGEEPPPAPEEEEEEDDDWGDYDDSGLAPATPRWSLPPTARSEGNATDYIVIGAPLTGKSTIASRLSKQFSYPVLKVDEIVDLVMEKKSDLGVKVRASLGKSTEFEMKSMKSKIADLEAKITAEAEEKAAAAGGKGKKKGAVEEVAEPSPAEIELEAIKNPSGPDAALLEEVIRWRIESADCGFGSIVDGLDSQYLPVKDVAAILKKVVPDATLVEFTYDEESYAKKMEALFLEATEDIGELEEEYAELPLEEPTIPTDGEGEVVAPPIDSPPPKPKAKVAPPMTPMTNMTELPVSNDDIENFDELDDMDLFMLTEQAKRHYWASREANRNWRYKRAIDLVARLKSVWTTEEGLLGGVKEETEPAEGEEKAPEEAKADGEATGEDEPAEEKPAAPAVTYFSYKADADVIKPLFKVEEAPAEDAPADSEEKKEVAEDEKKIEDTETPPEVAGETEEPTETPVEEEPKPPVVKGLLEFMQPEPACTIDSTFGDFLKAIPKPTIEPPVPGALLIPNPTIRQVIKRPYPRMELTPIFTEEKGYEILPFVEEGAEDPNAAPAADGAEPTNASAVREGRWVVEANSSVKFVVKFHSEEIFRLDSALNFEVVGGGVRPFMLPCVGHCEVPTINSDPRNVFMNRIKTRPLEAPPVSKRFVLSREVYEFGPLLAWKEAALKEPVADDADEKAKYAVSTTLETNSENFRISNNGSFPAVVDLFFESSRATEPDPAKDLFTVDPAHLELEVGDTADVRVWCFPKEVGALFEDSLVATLKDSPFETKFDVSSLGAAPTVQLTGDWTNEAELLETRAEQLIPPPPEPAVDEEGNEVAPPAVDPEIQKEADELLEKAKAIRAEPLIDFDRLLLNRSEEKDFVVTNNGVVPLEWKLDASDLESLEEFRISPTEGMLMPGEDVRVVVGFSAIEEKELNPSVTVHWSDAEQGFESEQADRMYSSTISIKAESYSIKAVAFEEDDESNDGVVDFDKLRVGDTASHKFSLRNRGKYEISYDFSFRRPGVAHLFKIEPANGTIEPGAAAEVTLTFTSLEEVSLKNNRDIKCVISEPHTGEAVENFTVSVSVTSHFSRLRLQPARGLNFGAIKYNEEPKTRRFELKNEGLFEYTFTVTGQEVDDASMGSIVAATPEGLRKEGATPGGAVSDAPKEIGQFVVTPSGGVLQPGQSMGIEVKFIPKGSSVYREDLKILISGCDEADNNVVNASMYECIGESCFPGVVINDFRSIFEEQTVIGSMSELGEVGVNNKSTSKTAGNSNAIGKAVFAEEDVLFNYGNVISSTTEADKGTVEKFRITNPTKVNSVVSFELSGSNGGEASDVDCFTIQPSSWDIPAHEYRYVSVYFRPKEMKAYRCSFSANVADSHESQEKPDGSVGSKIAFDLTGAGTLPCVNVTLPSTANEEGQLLMPFGSVELGKSRTLPIHLSNDGVVPCTVLFEMSNSDCFSFSKADGSETMEPGEQRQLQVFFKPKAVDAEEQTSLIKMTVMHNSYETQTLKLTGACFSNDAIIQDIEDDELKFDEVDLNSSDPSSHVAFSIRSQVDEPLKFEFKPHEHFKFVPSVGHLPPNSVKDVVAKFFTGGENKTYKAEGIEFSTTKIEYSVMEGDEKVIVQPSIVGWDDSMKEVRAATEEESAEVVKNAEAGEGAPPLSFKVVEVVNGVQMIEIGTSEPECAVTGEPQVQLLKCTGVADTTKFECETRSVMFKSTAMFQKRVHRFTVSNKGDTQLSFNWALENVPERLRPADAPRPAHPPVPCPYTIEPSEGAIPAQSEQQFVVTFAPVEVDDFCYLAKCNMPSLVKTEEGPNELVVSIRGKSNRPIVHVELGDQNDYLSRRQPNLRNELGLFGQIEASSVRVVEMVSRGTRVRNTKRFHVINPTSNNYNFSWVPQGNPSPAWRCVTSKGMILAGKRGEMVFEYTPDDVAVAESFFKFSIQGTSVDEIFLFTGSVVEPVVAFDRQRLDFGAQLLGGLCTDTVHIVNDENLPFSFSFDAMSMGGAGDVFPGFKRPVLEISPMSGLVPPNGRIPVTINFSPAEEKFHNYNLVCHVRKKPHTLNLNLKGEGYAVHSKLILTEESAGNDGDGEREMIDKRRGVNFVDFGNVHLNEKLVKKLSVSNTGKFNVDYSWSKNKNNPMLQILGGKSHGSLKKGERLEFTLEFSPVTETMLDGIELVCTIAGRYDYVFQIGGSGVRPNLHFSFTQFDFGARFITAPGAALEPAESVLLVTNRDVENSLSIDCAFVNQRALNIESKPTVLEPGEALEIPFLFAPREMKDYEFQVPFLVNGTSKQMVAVSGKGVYARLELLDLQQSRVNFGNIVEGNSVSRNVKVVNRSAATMTFNIVDEDKVGFGKKKLEYNDIMYFPAGPVTLGPHESTVINLTFSPVKRLMQFTEELLVRYAGETRKLLSMSGGATGFEVMLETDALPFGVVMAGSKRIRKLNFENSGDMPARCKWLEGTFGENFSITPLDVNVPPNSEFAFDVVFHPTYMSDDIRQEGIKLLVDGSDPLTLTCSGGCVPQPDDTIKTLSFKSSARKAFEQTVSVSNPTDKVWVLTPVMKGIHWFGMDEISVPGKGSVDYKVTYFPLSMTGADAAPTEEEGTEVQEEEGAVKKEAKHKGSLFFSLPNGSALLYHLEGEAGEPEPEGRVGEKTAAKSMLTVPLPVKNWLRHPQKFKVDITLADEAEGSSTFLEGANQIDVPSMATREYPLRFFSYKEGSRAAIVKFTNVETGEYLFHEVAVEVGPAEVQDLFKLEAPVRQVAKRILSIDNPLGVDKEITFKEDWWKCDNEFVRLRPIGKMAGNKEGTFEIEYRPLVPTASVEKASLSFEIEELGLYKYDLELTAMPPSAAYQLRFECPLGGKQTETFTFKTFNKVGGNFDNSVEKPQFFDVEKSTKVDACEDVWEGQNVRLQVSFEPSSIGEVRDVLKVQSKDFGEYSCTLVGVCKPQLPQGPFELADGGTKDIEFRNVFDSAMDFNFVCDDPRFTVNAGVVNIPARGTKGVQVKYVKGEIEEGRRGPEKISAKLSVRCVGREDVPAWIYYLSGKKE